MFNTKFYRDADGRYIGAFAGALPPAGAIEVATPPDDARQMWADGVWQPLPPGSMPPRTLTKLQIVDRATDVELAVLAALRGSSDPTEARFAARWDAAVIIEPDDPATAAAFAAVFGVQRAAELLA